MSRVTLVTGGARSGKSRYALSRCSGRERKAFIATAAPVDEVVDTTGAGDAYAAGFLFGLAKGRDAKTCGQLGSLAASEVISHFGARPEADLKDLASEAGLL